MSRIRLAKVRIIPPPGAGGKSPLEADRLTRGGSVGKTGLDFLMESQKREAASHDAFLRDYSPETLQAAWEDLKDRPAWDKKDQEHRWVMARRAALLRRGSQMRREGRPA